VRRPGVLVALILAVGTGGTVVALESREGNAQFVLQQQSLAPVGPAALQALLLTTRDSRPGYGGPLARALQAHCSSPSHGALGNPWTCVVRYPRPPNVRFRVTVHADRSISGSGQPEGHPLRPPLTVSGCCVETS
jgi:hypothetical protein